MATSERTRETAQAEMAAREILSAAIYRRDQFESYIEYGDPNDKSAESALRFLNSRVKYARQDLEKAERAHWAASQCAAYDESMAEYAASGLQAEQDAHFEMTPEAAAFEEMGWRMASQERAA